MVTRLLLLVGVCCACAYADSAAPSGGATNPTNSSLRVAAFDIDVTPPIGSMMAYDPVTNRWDLGLRARGVVLLGAGEPIVLCAVDWIGIANEAHDAFRAALARAAATSPSRVAVHTVHQHDAPECDFSAERILKDAGLPTRQYEGTFQRQVIANLEKAVRESMTRAQTVTHIGTGHARVEQVASNRRILGAEGKIRATRFTTTKDPLIRAEPEGVIDPNLSLVGFWNSNQPVAVLTYYASHPQSYYRTGIPNPDFPGLARFFRQLAVPAALHVHFTGAGGNIGAGKYNDGSHENRLALAQRLADGMRRAWESQEKHPARPGDVQWIVESVALPPSKHLDPAKLESGLEKQASNASRLAWLRRCQSGYKVDIQCLGLGKARILHLPGESFVEYQLAAKAMQTNRFIAVAAYGDYAPWYIGTAIAYPQGGYETGPDASNVGPEAEPLLINAIRKALVSSER